jgi:hypothetical protein
MFLRTGQNYAQSSRSSSATASRGATSAIVPHIVGHSTEKQPILDNLAPFSEIASRDHNELHWSYFEIYMSVCDSSKPAVREEDLRSRAIRADRHRQNTAPHAVTPHKDVDENE